MWCQKTKTPTIFFLWLIPKSRHAKIWKIINWLGVRFRWRWNRLLKQINNKQQSRFSFSLHTRSGWQVVGAKTKPRDRKKKLLQASSVGIFQISTWGVCWYWRFAFFRLEYGMPWVFSAVCAFLEQTLFIKILTIHQKCCFWKMKEKKTNTYMKNMMKITCEIKCRTRGVKKRGAPKRKVT